MADLEKNVGIEIENKRFNWTMRASNLPHDRLTKGTRLDDIPQFLPSINIKC